jgi:hypothetical protein
LAELSTVRFRRGAKLDPGQVTDVRGRRVGGGGLAVGADDVEFDRVEAGITIERMTGILDERAREILRLRFEEDLTQAEIGERIGVSFAPGKILGEGAPAVGWKFGQAFVEHVFAGVAEDVLRPKGL